MLLQSFLFYLIFISVFNMVKSQGLEGNKTTTTTVTKINFKKLFFF
jgi:hypothetical protein